MEPNIKVEDFEWRNRPDKVDQVYEFTKTLGRGSHAKVKLGREKKTGEMVAIKVMEKKSSKFEYDTLCREIKVMKAVDHPHCIKLYDVFEDKEKCYLVQELASGGELFERVIANGAFSEKDAASLIKQLFEAVGYLHSSGIVHRDLKPENLLMKSGDAASPHYNILKLADFGLSTFQAEMTQATMLTACGTPEYIAPEIIAALEDTDDERIPYSGKVDIWAVGVICYVLLCGYQPFQLENQKAMYSAIRKGKYSFPSPEWDGVSTEAQSFISFVLKLDPFARPAASECLRHPWVASIQMRRTQSIGGNSLRLQINLSKYTKERKENRLEQFMAIARRGIRRLSVQAGSMASLMTGQRGVPSSPSQRAYVPASPGGAPSGFKGLPPPSPSHASTLEAGRSVRNSLVPSGEDATGGVSRSSSANSFVPEVDAPEADAI